MSREDFFVKKRWIALFLTLSMSLPLAACGGEETQDVAEMTKVTEISEPEDMAQTEDTAAPEESGNAQAGPGGESWAVYWYLCGSDLESNGGCATIDLTEMMEVELPENVTVVIQTGGAALWQNELIAADKIQRWVYSGQELTLVDEQESANMGDAQTLYEFLDFANTNFPADKVAVTFWNHGGGSVSGAAFDELYEMDSLDLSEMYQAFNEVWPADQANPALELVGFDTCLMATVDVAAVFQNFSRYLVASEEVEPGNGWLYSGWLGELAQNPGMDGGDLGIAICNTYYEGCEAVGTEAQTTLSVTDLTKLTPLLDAYEAGASFGKCLAKFLHRPRRMTLHGFEGYNLSVYACAGSELIFVTALCRVCHEAFSHESRGEGGTRGVTPELFHNICFRLLHFHYSEPVGYG